MSKAPARTATSLPIRPSPIRPSVLPRTSVPAALDFSQRPSCIALSCRGTCRASASNSAKVCSATLTAFPPGVLMTRTPRRVASSRSMLSTPTPARPTTRSRGAFSRSSGVTLVALRTIRASASAICAFSVSLVVRTMFHPALRSRSTPRSLILSATITFIDACSSLDYHRMFSGAEFDLALRNVQRATTGTRWGAKRKQVTVATCSTAVKSLPYSDFAVLRILSGTALSFSFGSFAIFEVTRSGDESCGENPEGSDGCDAGERRAAAERVAHGQVRDHVQRDGKAAKAGEAAQGIDRAIWEGWAQRPRGQGNERDGDHRDVSSRGRQ